MVFDEPDVTRVLEILRPAVHAKGTDYTEATVPEREAGSGLWRAGANYRRSEGSFDARRDSKNSGNLWKVECVKPNISRILVVKFGSLGDIVHCLPSVAQLRAAFPNAEIDWLVERKNKIAVDLSGLDVRLVPIDTYQWRNSPEHRQRPGDCGICLGAAHGRLRLRDRFPGTDQIGILRLSFRRASSDRLGARLPEGVRQPPLLYGGRETETNSHHRSADGIAEASRDRSGLVRRSAAQGIGSGAQIRREQTEGACRTTF